MCGLPFTSTHSGPSALVVDGRYHGSIRRRMIGRPCILGFASRSKPRYSPVDYLGTGSDASGHWRSSCRRMCCQDRSATYSSRFKPEGLTNQACGGQSQKKHRENEPMTNDFARTPYPTILPCCRRRTPLCPILSTGGKTPVRSPDGETAW